MSSELPKCPVCGTDIMVVLDQGIILCTKLVCYYRVGINDHRTLCALVEKGKKKE